MGRGVSLLVPSLLTTARLAPTAAITHARVTGGMSVIHCSTGCAMVTPVPDTWCLVRSSYATIRGAYGSVTDVGIKVKGSPANVDDD
jgi:hypothetical protein